MTLLNLACGLDLDEIENPSHILRQLTANLGDADQDKNGELLELANPSSEQAADNQPRAPLLLLPSLLIEPHFAATPTARAFKCTCPRLSVDQQRARYCSRVYGSDSGHANCNGPSEGPTEAMDRERQLPLSARESPECSMALDGHDNANRSQSEGLDAVSLPSIESQLGQFGRMSRNCVARRWFRLYGRRRRQDFIDSGNNNLERAAGPNHKEEDDGSGWFQADVASLSMYKIEEFLLEANGNLAKILASESRRSSLVLGRILQSFLLSSRAQISHEMLQEEARQPWRRQPVPVVMIRAPLPPNGRSVSSRSRCLQQPPIGANPRLRVCGGGGSSSSRYLWAGFRRGDSGIDLDCEDRDLEDLEEGCGCGGSCGSGFSGWRRAEGGRINLSGSEHAHWSRHQQLTLVEELLEFRSDFRVQSIVRQSVELFGKLIDESPLFSLINTGSNGNSSNLFNSQELKLYACIECQRLRSSIRFEWITQCLMVAFSQAEQAETPSTNNNELLAKLKSQRANRRRHKPEDSRQCECLPPIEAHKLEDLARLRYFDSLALLMGNLLRQHFLVPALERWHRLLEAHQQHLVPDIVASCPGPGYLMQTAAAPETITTKPKLGIQVDLVELEGGSGSHINDGSRSPEPPGSSNLLVSSSGTQPTLLASSKPEDELKQTLGFVVDELAGICRRLPRLETQLESQALPLDCGTGSGQGERDKFILSLEAEDNLLLEAKRRLGYLIDCSNVPLSAGAFTAANNYGRDAREWRGSSDQLEDASGGLEGGIPSVALDLGQSRGYHQSLSAEVEIGREFVHQQKQLQQQQQQAPKWVNSDYLRIIELVNNFRRGVDSTPWSEGGLHAVAAHDGNFIASNGLDDASRSRPASISDDDDGDDDRLHRLQACCKQIRLLDSLEEQLTCKLSRHHDHGFVLLDYGPLRDSLLKCIHKERLLLVRLHLDELLRLMDRLRLHFEEIEFGVDLELAIEDYLADRRQWKQSQHQQVLMGDDDGLGADPYLSLEQQPPVTSGDLDGPQQQQQQQQHHHHHQHHHSPTEAASSAAIKHHHHHHQPQVDSRHLLQIADDNDNDDHGEIDEFVEAITQGHTNEGHKLLALGAAADRSLTTDSEERRVVPIIECQLLVARYEFMSDLLANELKSLAGDIRVAFEGGLVFLSEFVGHDQLDPSHWQLITELAVRSSDFRPMLSHSLARLRMARIKLCHSNELRSQVLSRLTLEFHQLIGELAARYLAADDSNHYEPASSMAEPGGPGRKMKKLSGKQQQLEVDSSYLGPVLQGRRIVQLDTIQETAAWAGELELRFRFLWQQNTLLAREGHLLRSRAKLLVPVATAPGSRDDEAPSDGGARRDPLLEEAEGGRGFEEGERFSSDTGELWRVLEEAGEAQASILGRWRPLAGLVANLWRLIEEYETQQVKWLNSDTKRIDFLKMDSAFRLFQQRFNQIRDESLGLIDGGKLDAAGGDWSFSLKHNLQELDWRFGRFARRRLPLFKFLTNKYLTDDHWRRVNEILQGGGQGGGDSINRSGVMGAMFAGPTMAPQACTTLAQFLELNAERHVEELEKISREAIIEQELTNFLLAEVGGSLANNDKYLTSERRAQLRALDMSGAWFVGWTEKQLVMAAARFIEAKRLEERLKNKNMTNDIDSILGDDNFGGSDGALAAKLVACHSMVRRHLKLRYAIGLDGPTLDLVASRRRTRVTSERPAEVKAETENLSSSGQVQMGSPPVTLRTCKQLTSPELVTPSLFVEFLRLFTVAWLRGRSGLARRLAQLELDRTTIDRHLADIATLVDQANGLRETELRLATSEGEATLVGLERESVRLEIEREILATMESLALERQREALGKRDKCIRQITERAIPAIRAATRALDCLDARSLKTLRYVRPNPPEAVRLVLEAVCLLRSCAAAAAAADTTTSGSSNTSATGSTCRPMEPERHFDALSGRIREDYWQPACRMLNGTHSTKFLADLRRVDRRRMPAQVMRLIRRRYLSSSKFQPALIGRVSPECGLLSRWLIAVDVFDRVINVVRPNYANYLESERQLAGLLAEVNSRRAQIESIGSELQRMEEALEGRIGLKMSLADSLDQCCHQLKRIEVTRKELVCRRLECCEQVERLRRQQSRLANRCLMRAAKTVYLEAMRPDECKPMASLLRLAIQAADLDWRP